jgi:phosphotransferase system HPr (HPr) family protein
MQEFNYTIKDENGIHARPAGEFVKLLEGFKSAVTIVKGESSCSGKKLIALMKLRAKCGDTLTVRVEGEDEEAAAKAAAAFLEANL